MVDFTKGRTADRYKNMSESDKASNNARDKELMKRNEETAKRAGSGSQGDAIRMFSEAANRKLQDDIATRSGERDKKNNDAASGSTRLTTDDKKYKN